MRIGGVERSLIGLLNTIDYQKYSVDLFLFNHDGDLLNQIPENVNLLRTISPYDLMIAPVTEILKRFRPDVLLTKLFAKRKARKYCTKNGLANQNMVYPLYLQKEFLKILPQINSKNYDLAISFVTPHLIAAKKVNAKKRISWIHTDYSFFEFDKLAEKEMWDAYDYIASISEDCTKGFVGQFPELNDKIRLIENILDPDFIKAQSKSFSTENEMPVIADGFRFLSAGRFTHQKNFDNVPAIASELKRLGLKFKWYLIGFGGDEELINQKIKELEMEEIVIILGKKENPYPYMAACDIYIQPSRFEGKAVTVREAQILEKPIVITNYATSSSQLKDGFDGLIVSLDNQQCAKSIYELTQNSELIQELIENCRNSDYSNKSEVEKIYELIK